MLKLLGSILKVTAEVTEVTLEVASSIFQANEPEYQSESQPKPQSQATYDYWMSLSYQEQEEYFNYNEYLKDYINTDYYPNSKEFTAKHVQNIADRLNKEFTNKNYRY